MNSFEIKSIRMNALCLLLKSLDFYQIEQELHDKKFNDLNTFPFVLDLSLYNYSELHDIKEVIYLFEKFQLNVIAIEHYDEHFSQLAKQLGLFFQLGIKANQTPESIGQHSSHSPDLYQKDTKTFGQTVIIDKPVRSGQQIYAENSDLIITSLVSEGAEIVADGNIHAYSSVRGRVFAGASGNLNAQIFILSMQAQLICIAGIYRIFDQKLPSALFKQNVRITLQENKLSMTAIHP